MTQNPLKTTVTAFIFHENKLLLVMHKRLGTWMHVGGHAEDNETLDETLHREVKEEVNLKITCLEEFKHFTKAPQDSSFKILPVPFYIHVRTASDKSHRRMSFDFVAVAEDISTLKIQDEELDGHTWFTRQEIENSKEIKKPLQILALKAFEVYENWLKSSI